jgi:thiaminase/transcriptional activator TenA
MPHESFFEHLCRANAEIHHACLTHPMVQGIGAGNLPDSTFRFYIEQDYQYLVRYIRAQATAIACSPDLPTARRLAELVHGTLSLEIDGLIALHADFGGGPADLESCQPAPACRGYTDHLLACAASHDLLLILASMLPCQWGYRDIGQTLLAAGLPQDTRYGQWIQDYASDEYSDLVDWLIERCNALAANASAERLARAEEAFHLSSRHELAFWEMAYTQQTWPRFATTIPAGEGRGISIA